MKKNIVIIGAGEGLGKSIAKEFGNNDFKVFLLARNLDKLNKMVKELAVNNIEAVPIQADITDQANFDDGLNKIKAQADQIDVLVYNAGITSPDGDQLSVSHLQDHLNLDVLGAYQSVMGLHKQVSAAKGSILFTGGFAAVNPFPGYLGLAVGKAALRNLARGLNHDLQDEDIFVGTITIYGEIAPNTHFSPDNIAKSFWQVNEDRNKWEFDYK